MGQQQLLLLVLSTVIVGLATVAGIQAFSENQQQATQDALVQRAITLGNDVAAAANKPTQLGGIGTLGSVSTDSDIANAIGIQSLTGIDADGAGESAACEIQDANTKTVKCGSNGATSGDVQVSVDVNPGTDDPVTVNNIDVTS